MGDESGGEPLEEPIEVESDAELSELESIGNSRWCDELDNERLDDYAAEDGQENEDMPDVNPEESAPKRPRLDPRLAELKPKLTPTTPRLWRLTRRHLQAPRWSPMPLVSI